MTTVAEYAARIRQFNRFYTQRIGALAEGFLESPFSLTEARVLYELAQYPTTTATALNQTLGLDPGYLSRIIRLLKKQGLIVTAPSTQDRRQTILQLSEAGQVAFAGLNQRSQANFEQVIRHLAAPDQQRLIQSMETIEQILGGSGQPSAYLIRQHQPGDMGWVIYRHAVLYSQTYHWNHEFEALVASIVAQFLRSYDPQRERCWMAEIDGQIVGSVFLVKKTDTIAQLRLLLVEPSARGLGIGTRLINECIRFARQSNYHEIQLWTNHILVEARRLYQQAGFSLIHEEAHHSFGHDLIGETWQLTL